MSSGRTLSDRLVLVVLAAIPLSVLGTLVVIFMPAPVYVPLAPVAGLVLGLDAVYRERPLGERRYSDGEFFVGVTLGAVTIPLYTAV